MSVMEQISQAVIKGEIEEIERLTHEALNAGNTAQEILNEALIPAITMWATKCKKDLCSSLRFCSPPERCRRPSISLSLISPKAKSR